MHEGDEYVDIAIHTGMRIKSLSTGFASILRVVIALSTGVDFILLGEPTLGMDANHRDLFY